MEGNRKFGELNQGLAYTLGVLYLIYVFAFTSMWRWDVGIILYLILFLGFYFYSRYHEGYSFKIVWIAALHALAHMLVIVLLSWVALRFNERALGTYEWHWFFWLAALAIFVLPLGSWLAGKIFGWHLLLTCRHFNINHNDAFSSMRLDSHRHFLRICIKGDTLTVYPIKLDRVPTRDQWRKNPARDRDPFASVFVSEPAMTHQLIEKPIVIQSRESPATAQVKTPSELPRQR